MMADSVYSILYLSSSPIADEAAPRERFVSSTRSMAAVGRASYWWQNHFFILLVTDIRYRNEVVQPPVMPAVRTMDHVSQHHDNTTPHRARMTAYSGGEFSGLTGHHFHLT